MNENKKLEEAKYFLEKMIAQKKSLNDFRNNLSAFLSASRSVFQYAYKECKINPTAKSWYEQKTASSLIIKFLKNKRDLNIHSEPVKTQVQHLIQATATISTSITAIVSDKDGNIISKKEFVQKPQSNNSIKSDVIYNFNDWSGNEDIITLCSLYVTEIENFINDGQKLYFLTK